MTNAAPTGGHVEATPRAGVAALDTFTLESLDWSDDVDDLPLMYSFSSMVRTLTTLLYTLVRCNARGPVARQQSGFLAPWAAPTLIATASRTTVILSESGNFCSLRGSHMFHHFREQRRLNPHHVCSRAK